MNYTAAPAAARARVGCLCAAISTDNLDCSVVIDTGLARQNDDPSRSAATATGAGIFTVGHDHASRRVGDTLSAKDR
jgi:hypothetical protein